MRWHNDGGSLPLAMLATIVVVGLVVVVTSTTIAGQRQTRFDQGYEQSLQIAEVGLDRMAYQVQNYEVFNDSSLDGETSDGGTYDTSAVYDESEDRWTLTSTGVTPSGEERSIELTIEPEPLFAVAAFGKFFVDFNGGNAADSYRSGSFSMPGGSFTKDPTGSYICEGGDGTTRVTATGPGNSDIRMCNETDKGVVATNGELNLKGNAWDKTDAAEVHYAMDQDRIDEEPHPSATGYCSMAGWRCDDEKVSYFRDELVVEPDPVEIPGHLDSEGRFPQDFGSNVLPAGEHLFSDVTLDADTVIEGDPEDPTVIYITGQLSIPNHDAVNFTTGADGHPEPRPAPSLLIFSNSDGSEALSFGNHASLAGAVFAPNAGFSGGAQGNVYGSLIAGSINNNGGWNFHWDEALADMIDYAPLVQKQWFER